MPDYVRQQPADRPMGPRSPVDPNHPLALVIGKRGEGHHHHHHHSPPNSPNERKIGHQSESQARSPEHSSSGYSEPSPAHSGPESPKPQDEAPLALVVHREGDSGHEDDFHSNDGSSPKRFPVHEGLVVKRRDSKVDNEERVEIQPNVTIVKVVNEEEKAGGAGSSSPLIKIKDFARMDSEQVPQLRIVEDDGLSEAASSSDISSVDNYKNEGGTFPCEFCDKVFVNRYHLQSHLVTHTGERAFDCRHCGKSFGRKSTLRAHMTTHTKTSNFMCPMCDKACNDNNSLEEHIRMHTGEKPFVCSICSKAYARKSHLNVHYRVHTGERPFVCVDCGKDFTEKRFLNDHMQTAHSGTGQEGPLRCQNCFREFAYKTSLKQHLKKQMCAKNLNRGQGNPAAVAAAAAIAAAAAPNHVVLNANNGIPSAAGTNSGQTVHSKQFQCPFCEKSYSWKQTLKQVINFFTRLNSFNLIIILILAFQHVSMYHRNKVHTDEFWKYELSKHRRVSTNANCGVIALHGQDGNVVNEDMWKKQLGRHAVEDVNNNGNNYKWLDQIQKQQQGGPNQAAVSAEMKLLALQSLQFMQQKIKAPSSALPPPPPPPPPKHTSQEGYLTLLAQMRAQNNTNHHHQQQEGDFLSPPSTLSSSRSPSLRSSPRPTTVLTPMALPDIKEEPAAKRTQMWLAQLGHYRQKSLLQEEMDRNHDELWEEQIARKKSAAASAAKPAAVEINLDEEDSASSVDPLAEIRGDATASAVPPPKPVMQPLMSALQVRGSASLARRASATITRPPTEEEEEEKTQTNGEERRTDESSEAPSATATRAARASTAAAATAGAD